MLIRIPGILNDEEVDQCRQKLAAASWQDGRRSAGYLSAGVKRNAQLADNDPTARELGELVLTALERSPRFTSAALPLKIVPPLFNRYASDERYGNHIDGAIRPISGSPHKVRTDLSATLFLTDPDDYEGGELVVQDTFGERRIKLPAGDMVLYPGTSVHEVLPVKSGARLASFFWIQSMVRDQNRRTMLFQFDEAIQSLAADVPGHDALVALAGLYHNLVRAWADT